MKIYREGSADYISVYTNRRIIDGLCSTTSACSKYEKHLSVRSYFTLFILPAPRSSQRRKRDQKEEQRNPRNLYIPAAIDLMQTLAQNPPFKNFNVDFAYYLIDLIMDRSVRFQTEEDFVSLSSVRLKKACHAYKKHLDYLLQVRIIITDNHYVPGEKCRGYRIAPEFLSEGIMTITTNRKSVGHVLRGDAFSWKAEELYWYLMKDLHELQLSYEVYDFILQDYERKMTGVAPLDQRKGRRQLEEFKDPGHQRSCSERLVRMIHDGHRYARVGGSHRLYTDITSMPSALRNFLLHPEGRLVTIDVKACQIFLLAQVLKPEFWKAAGSHLSFTDINTEVVIQYTNLASSLNSPSFCSYILPFIEGIQSNEDFRWFCHLSETGHFYEEFQELLRQKTGKEYTRDEVKVITVQILFADSRGRIEGRKEFREAFPSVYKIITLLRQPGKDALPGLLQSIESTIMLGRVSRWYKKDNGSMPLYSVHDCLICLESEKEAMMEIIEDQFIKAFGLAPKVKVSLLAPTEAKFSDGELYITENSKPTVSIE